MKTKRITPAALSALAQGDIDNCVVALTPGGIEAQEKQGQIEQSFLETLPRDGTVGLRKPSPNIASQWEALGFVFDESNGKFNDDLFVAVKFPEGWKKRCSDHSMWSELLDAKGRVRALIFYKAAFYDRSAHVHFQCRYSMDYHRQVVSSKDLRLVAVMDGGSKGTEIHVVGTWNYLNHKDCDARRAEGLAWLRKNLPDFENPHAYWD